METDHMKPQAEGGDDSIENAIPVCFDCHAEIHSYNPKHPRGRMYTSDELNKHKERWLRICADLPATTFSKSLKSDREVGPIQALVDEIEFNVAVATETSGGRLGCPFQQAGFFRAVSKGSIALLAPELKTALINAYVSVGRADTLARAAAEKRAGGLARSLSGGDDPTEAARNCVAVLENARRELLRFLGHGPETA